MNFIPPFDETRLRAAASGTLASGKPVVVNADETVSVVSGESGNQSLGTETQLKATASKNFSTTYDSNSDRFVVCFDAGNEGFAVVINLGTDNSVTAGTPVKFGDSNGETNIAAIFDSNSNRVVIGYKDSGNSNNATGIVGSVDPSDNSIAFGTKVQWSTGNPTYLSGVFDSTNNKVVFNYNDNSNSEYGTTVTGTVDPSDNSISFGSVVVWNSARSRYIASSYDPDRNKIIVCYTHSNSVNQLRVRRVNGTSTTAVTGPITASADNDWRYPTMAYDTKNDKTLLAWKGAGGTGGSKTRVISLDSDGAATLGSEVTFDSSTSIAYLDSVYNATAQFVVLVHKGKGTNNNHGVFKPISISGTTPTVGSEVSFASGETNFITVASRDAQVCVGFEDDDDSDYSKAIGITLAYSTTTLTSENYIGMSSGGQVASGSNATVDIIGTVNAEQSSLTAGQQYFVQTDGTIDLTADDPSVFAGTAISATELVVKA